MNGRSSFAIALVAAGIALSGSPSRAQIMLGPFEAQAVLDAGYPGDHIGFQTSHYLSARVQAVNAGQFATAEIMFLDEILQLVQTEAACRDQFPRGITDHAACMAELDALPPLLERLTSAATARSNSRSPTASHACFSSKQFSGVSVRLCRPIPPD